MQNYSTLHDTNENDEEGNVLVHVAEPSRARWNHVHDLDSFFSRVYQYHQRHGFCCMVVQETLELLQFIFMVFLTVYVMYGVRYDILFHRDDYTHKITLNDVLLSPSDCIKQISLFVWFLLFITFIIWFYKLLISIYDLFYSWDIKQFYNIALKIDDKQLDNLTWHEIQDRLLKVQVEQQMCIHKRELSELDIYHRILRQQNYFVAMVNKHLLPARINIPLINTEMVYWTSSFQFILRILFFWSPWAPFENSWQLRADYKRPNLRHELGTELGKQILWTATITLILSPLITIWTILYTFFNYAAIIRREPGILTVRRWSPFAKLYIRHFNELDHELQARLARAHKPATKYFLAFSSSMSTIIAESIGFFIASILAVFLCLTVYDEDVINVEHVLTIISVLSISFAAIRKMTPNETLSWDIRKLISEIALHIHYVPDGWKNEAHTPRVRDEFAKLFHYTFMEIIHVAFSAFFNSFFLFFYVYPRRLDFVDFFRNFTVSVVGVGDVCSFAQMDIKRHGNPDWNNSHIDNSPPQCNQGEDGKTEMSLMHFTYTNPTWRPNEQESMNFVSNVQEQSNMIRSRHDALFQSMLNEPDLFNNYLRLHQQQPQQQQLASMLSIGYIPDPCTGIDYETFKKNRMDVPTTTSYKDMQVSISCLQDRHTQRSDRNNDRQPAIIQVETTPLLSNH